MSNTTFSNCFSNYGYLIDIRQHIDYNNIVPKNIKVTSNY